MCQETPLISQHRIYENDLLCSCAKTTFPRSRVERLRGFPLVSRESKVKRTCTLTCQSGNCTTENNYIVHNRINLPLELAIMNMCNWSEILLHLYCRLNAIHQPQTINNLLFAIICTFLFLYIYLFIPFRQVL